jgi:hypothetical protein
LKSLMTNNRLAPQGLRRLKDHNRDAASSCDLAFRPCQPHRCMNVRSQNRGESIAKMSMAVSHIFNRSFQFMKTIKKLRELKSEFILVT